MKLRVYRTARTPCETPLYVKAQRRVKGSAECGDGNAELEFSLQAAEGRCEWNAGWGMLSSHCHPEPCQTRQTDRREMVILSEAKDQCAAIFSCLAHTTQLE